MGWLREQRSRSQEGLVSHAQQGVGTSERAGEAREGSAELQRCEGLHPSNWKSGDAIR